MSISMSLSRRDATKSLLLGLAAILSDAVNVLESCHDVVAVLPHPRHIDLCSLFHGLEAATAVKAEQGSFGLAGVDFGETPRGLDAARTPIADRDSFLILKAFRLVLEALHPNEEGLLLAYTYGSSTGAQI